MQPIWTVDPGQEAINKEILLSIKNIKESGVRNEISSLKKQLALHEQQGDTEAANRIINAINVKLTELEAIKA
jgi:hypothetical protein